MRQYNSEAFRVSMRDIDLNGHVHNAVYLDYCEDAIVNAFRRAGILPLFRPDTAGVAYHVKKCEATFHAPLSVDDIVEPLVMLEKLGNSSVIFHVHLVARERDVLVAEGRFVWVCVSLDANAPRAVPDETRRALQRTFPDSGSA